VQNSSTNRNHLSRCLHYSFSCGLVVVVFQKQCVLILQMIHHHQNPTHIYYVSAYASTEAQWSLYARVCVCVCMYTVQGCWSVLSPTRNWTSYSDRRFWCSYILFITIIWGILVLFTYITRLASNEIFSPSNKILREVGRAKDLSAPRYVWMYVCIMYMCVCIMHACVCVCAYSGART